MQKKISKDEFPLYVAEGESSNKYRRIKNNPYLNDCFNFFNEVLNRKNACLFTHGISFSENDKHIFQVIRDSELEKLFVGIHGDFDSAGNRDIRTRALSYKARPVNSDLEIYFYNTQEVNPWIAFTNKSEDEG